jgi:hypothetical protein
VTTPSAEMANGAYRYVVQLPDMMISGVKGTAVTIVNALLFSVMISTSGRLKSIVSVMVNLSLYQIMFADSSTGSGVYL